MIDYNLAWHSLHFFIFSFILYGFDFSIIAQVKFAWVSHAKYALEKNRRKHKKSHEEETMTKRLKYTFVLLNRKFKFISTQTLISIYLTNKWKLL